MSIPLSVKVDEPAVETRPMHVRLLSYLLPHRYLLAVGMVCSLGVAAANLSLPWIAKRAFSVLHMPHHSPAEQSALQLNLLMLGLAGIGFFAFKWIVSVGQSLSFAEVGQRLSLRVRNDIYAHLQSLSMSYFDNQRTGNLISILNNDVPALQNGIMTIKDAITGPVIVAFSLASVMYISWRLSLFTLLLLPPIAYFINTISHKLRSISRETQDRLADMTMLTEETISSVRVVRSFAAEDREIARFAVYTENAKRIFMKGVARSSVLSPTTDLIGMTGIMAALFFGGHEVAVGRLTPDNLIYFIAMLDRLRNGISSIGTIMTDWRSLYFM